MTAPLYPAQCPACPATLETETTAVVGDWVGCLNCASKRAVDVIGDPSASAAEIEDAREVIGWQGAREATR